MLPVLLRPDQIQPADDAARLFAEHGEHAVARTLRDTLTALGQTFDQAGLARLIAENRFTEIWRHLAIERLRHALRPTLNRLAIIHDQAANSASLAIPHAHLLAKAAPKNTKTPAVINLTYDPLNADTVAAQNATNDALAAAIEDQAIRTAQQILSDGLAKRIAPAQIARSLRETLGMSELEAAAIESYRRALQSGTASSLSRALRDRRFDARVLRGDMSDDQIDQMTQRYADRYRAFRALRIARTESLRAANQGRRAAWVQYADATGRGVRRFWQTAGDEIVCAVCAPIPGMNPEGVALDEPYATPKGPMMMPPAHPNCRCTERFARFAGGASSSGVGRRIESDYGE
jgi:hypothetical protein